MRHRWISRAVAAAIGSSALASASATAQTRPSLCDAVSSNIVRNCGFESGMLGPWTGYGTLGQGLAVNSGTFGADFASEGGFGVSGGYDHISQALATAAGQTYAISFYASTLYPGASNAVRVLFGGVVVFEQQLQNSAYQEFIVTGIATGASTALEVDGYNNVGDDFLDDFVVQPSTTTTPEPAGWALLGAGLLSVGGVAVRRRRSTA